MNSKREKQWRRIEKLEREKKEAALNRSLQSEECICFPKEEQPFFGFDIEWETAKRVECPLHGCSCSRGARPIYTAKWRRKMEERRRETFSPQFQKAWAARFPSALWPAEEEETEGGIYLRLKEGTRILARARPSFAAGQLTVLP